MGQTAEQSADGAESCDLSVVLNVMGRLELADYGFRSWMIQDAARPYEVVLNLFNDQRARYDALAADRSPRCRLVINVYDRPAYFNISAANNLGLHAATGRFVGFVNSDVIYPAAVARQVGDELSRRDLCFAMASRMNLSDAQTRALDPPARYTAAADFAPLSKQAYDDPPWRGLNGWFVRADVARAIGGFDPALLVSEDQDLWERAMHYLRRHKLQDVVYGMMDVMGYHLYHPTSELFDTVTQAQAHIAARAARLWADPASEADVLPTRLDDRGALLQDMRDTRKPPPMQRYRGNVLAKVAGRFRRAFHALTRAR